MTSSKSMAQIEGDKQSVSSPVKPMRLIVDFTNPAKRIKTQAEINLINDPSLPTPVEPTSVLSSNADSNALDYPPSSSFIKESSNDSTKILAAMASQSFLPTDVYQKRRKSNAEAAKRSRVKRASRIQSFASKVAELEERNRELYTENSDLRFQLDASRQLEAMLRHRIHELQYLLGEPSFLVGKDLVHEEIGNQGERPMTMGLPEMRASTWNLFPDASATPGINPY